MIVTIVKLATAQCSGRSSAGGSAEAAADKGVASLVFWFSGDMSTVQQSVGDSVLALKVVNDSTGFT